jgi:hypothetical protein
MNAINLGNLIAALDRFDPDTPAPTIDDHGSYRGVYCDLYLDYSVEMTSTVGDLIVYLNNIVGTTHQGYKGGDNVMDETVEVYNATYGQTGSAIVCLSSNEEGVWFNVFNHREFDYE